MSAPPMPTPNNARAAAVLRVKDGDTLEVRLSLHPPIFAEPALRLAGVYAPELTAPGGPEAKAYVEGWCAEAVQGARGTVLKWPFVVVSGQDDVHGRWLGRIYARRSGRCLNDDVVRAGHAKTTPR